MKWPLLVCVCVFMFTHLCEDQKLECYYTYGEKMPVPMCLKAVLRLKVLFFLSGLQLGYGQL